MIARLVFAVALLWPLVAILGSGLLFTVWLLVTAAEALDHDEPAMTVAELNRFVLDSVCAGWHHQPSRVRCGVCRWQTLRGAA